MNMKIGLQKGNQSGCAGFTLIEVIIVMVLIGILATIATSSYHSYIKKSKKIEAKTNLSSLALLLEEYNSLYGRFCPACTDSNAHSYQYIEQDDGFVNAGNDTITSWLDIKPKQAASGSTVSYNYSVSVTSNTLYTLTATPVVTRGVLNDILTIDQDGRKTNGSKNGW